ncbi:MAG: hypothetical protein Q9217_004704 [Psora testacea]
MSKTCDLNQIHIKVDPPLTRGCKKRKRSNSLESATDRRASVANGHGSKNLNSPDYERSYNYKDSSIAFVSDDKVTSSPSTIQQSSPPLHLNRTASAVIANHIQPNLEQIEKSRAASTLWKLLCFLDVANVPEFMLMRGKESQKIWGPSGEVQEIRVNQIGLDDDVLWLLSDDLRIREAIERLEATSLITSEPGAYNRGTLILDTATQAQLIDCMDDPSKWRLQALILVCHTFPMHPYVEPLYGQLGRLQISHIQHIANHYRILEASLSRPIKLKVAEVLLAASYFLDISWKLEALTTVRAIIINEPPGYLHVWKKLRECTLTGLEIKSQIDESALWPVIHEQLDARSNALYGQLMLAYATHQIRHEKLSHASDVLNSFYPLNNDHPSTMELLILKKMEVTRGKIDRYQGNFEHARTRLTPPSDEDAKLDGVRGRHRISHLAGVLCELGESRKAEKLLRQEIGIMEKMNSQYISSGRCLQLSLAEALLEQGMLEEAEKIYLKLKQIIENCSSDFNIVLGIQNLRLWTGLARVSHCARRWSEAVTDWEKALSVSEDCNWKAGFIEMVICYSISHAKSELGELKDVKANIAKADDICRRKGRQFWLTGLGTHWLDFVWASLGHKPI